MTAMNQSPTAETFGLIRVSTSYLEGPEKGKPRPFEELWRDAVFELQNINGVNDFAQATAEAAAGRLSKEQFITRVASIESRAGEKRGPSTSASSCPGPRSTTLRRIPCCGSSRPPAPA